MELAVFTLKIEKASKESDEELLHAIMLLFEAFGCEVVGELTYEEAKDEEV